MADFSFAYPDIPYIEDRGMYDYFFMIDRTLREMGKAINTLSHIDPEAIAKLVMPKADGVSIRDVDNVWSVIRAPYASTSGEADKLSKARTISLTGDTTGSVAFDGSSNVSIATTTGVATKLRSPRTISLTGDATGSATFDGSTNIAIPTVVVNAGTADKLTTARTITLTGDTTGSAEFDGSANVSIATTTIHSKAADTASKATNADLATKAQVADKLSIARRIELTGDATGSTTFDGSKDVSIDTTVVNGGGGSGGGISTPYILTLTGDATGSATIDGSDVSITTTVSHAKSADQASQATLANAANTATKLATARKIELSGGTEGSAYFDGSKDINIVTTGSSGGDGPVTEPCEPGLQPPPDEVPEEYEDMPLDMSHRYEIPKTGDATFKIRYTPPEDGMIQVYSKSALYLRVYFNAAEGVKNTNELVGTQYASNTVLGVQAFVQGGVELGIYCSTMPDSAYFYAWKRKPTTNA